MLGPMDLNELERLLSAYKSGELETSDALDRIKNLHFEDIGFARVDHSRATRQGFPEVVFGGGKTRAQVYQDLADSRDTASARRMEQLYRGAGN